MTTAKDNEKAIDELTERVALLEEAVKELQAARDASAMIRGDVE